MYHAVIHLDHHLAEVLHFDDNQVQSTRVERHHHASHHQGGESKDLKAFFDKVCTALQDAHEVLVTGSHPVIGELRHHIESHHPALAPRIADYRPAAPLSQGQLLAMARQFFKAYDRMAGVPTPT